MLNCLRELALPRNAIAKRKPDSKPSGTGPFHVVDWQPGKKLTLAAEEGYWRGRPFLDGIEIEMGQSFRDQMTALELGRADLVEVAPEQVAPGLAGGATPGQLGSHGVGGSALHSRRDIAGGQIVARGAGARAWSADRFAAFCCRARDNPRPAFFRTG